MTEISNSKQAKEIDTKQSFGSFVLIPIASIGIGTWSRKLLGLSGICDLKFGA